jgi:hypothetical protein
MTDGMTEYPKLTPEATITELSRRFRGPGHDRCIYAVLGRYAHITPFADRLRDLCAKNSFSNADESVAFFDLNHALIDDLKVQGKFDYAIQLADKLREKELVVILNDTWSRWLSATMKAQHGLILAGFEVFFAYLDANALALVRQYAINGKHICLLIPGQQRDGQVWAFAETPQFQRQISGLVPEWTYILEEIAHG